MKRGNGEGSVYKYGDRWMAQVVVGWKEPDEEHQRTYPVKTRKIFKTKRDALEFIQNVKDGRVAKVCPRLIDYWNIFEQGEFLTLSKTKQTSYRIAWKKLKPLHLMHIDKISVGMLRDTVTEACPTYYPAKDCKVLLNALYKLAAAEGNANKDLPSFIILPKLEEKERVVFSEDELRGLWSVYESGNIRAGLPLLMIYTGMMPGEAQNLKVDMIKLNDKLIVNAGLKTAVRRKTPIVLPDIMLPVLEDLMKHATANGYVFVHNEDTFYEIYYSALEAAGCRKLPPYSCRHTTATALAISKNIAPQTITRIMRWSSSQMMDRYVHSSNQDALSAINTLSDLSDKNTTNE